MDEQLPNQNEKDFNPPRHWVGHEELNPGYWSDARTQEQRGQEFYEKPVEWLDKLQKSEGFPLARREFLTIMGASIAMTGLGCARRPVNKIIPYVVKPEQITPGVPLWYATTCRECSSACGVLAKTREGRPIKLEGNPEHPANQGALCARGQAGLLSLYDPDRLKAPATHSRTLGGRREMTWQEADALAHAKLKGLAEKGGRIRILSSEVESPSMRKLIGEFLAPFKDGALVEYEPLAPEELKDGQELSYGTAVVPHYKLEAADFILSFGADFLSTWIAPVEHARAWAKGRKLDSAKASSTRMSRLICFEPAFTVTGANADERYGVRPGDELDIALALAHELVIARKLSRFAADPAVKQALLPFKPEVVAQELGLSGGAALFKRLADEAWAAKGKGVVLAGGISSRGPDPLALQVAVNLLNSVLENEGATIALGEMSFALESSFAKTQKLVEEMKAGQVDVLVVHRSNPAFTLPRALGFEEALKKVPFVVTIASHEDETARLADLALPEHHPLENWGDALSRKGIHSLQQPVIGPIYSTRAFGDILLGWLKGAELKGSGLAAKAADWHGYLRAHWQERYSREVASAGGFENFWEESLRKGFRQNKASDPRGARAFRTAALARLPRATKKRDSALSLVLTVSSTIHDGRSANNAWLQELPDPVTRITWDNYLSVAPALAKRLSLAENDLVEMTVGGQRAELPVHVQPGMHPSTVSVAVGYGRRAGGKVGEGAGVDVYPFVEAGPSGPVFAGRSVELRKTGAVYSLASVQWHDVTEKRPIINDVTLAEFRKSPKAAMHTDPELRMEKVPSIWPAHEYKGHRWAMSIDLNSCTGCGACVVACQAENNIPVVGRNQVRSSRNMHWIRIDRYFSGTPENPDTVFEPMLCQHCDNAPCETVCPVIATAHSDEGLNMQVYNRCVGTRYCQNNCPYKVRRFNFFDFQKSYEGSMNMVWNPEVTVRTRGVMEKCTFCVQRIQDVKEKAKKANAKLRDGDVVTACQQTCPTEAIVFGDRNDPASRVAKLREDPRAFRILETLNTQPAISYLTKVRNKEEGKHHV